MKLPTRKSASILLIWLVLLAFYAAPAWAQLASYVDVKGNVVFINADPPPDLRAGRHGAVKSKKPFSPAAAVKTSAGPFGVAPARSDSAADRTKRLVPVVLPPAALDQVVQQSAEKNHVDPALVRAVISTESNWNSSAVSSKGALGLMQLIPGTAERLGVGNAFDPVQNVDAGTRYLGMLLQRYDGDLSKALAAYNAGPGAVDRFGGVPDYRETRNYVEKVTTSYLSPGSGRQPRAFVIPRPIYRALDADGRVVFSNE